MAAKPFYVSHTPQIKIKNMVVLTKQDVQKMGQGFESRSINPLLSLRFIHIVPGPLYIHGNAKGSSL